MQKKKKTFLKLGWTPIKMCPTSEHLGLIGSSIPNFSFLLMQILKASRMAQVISSCHPQEMELSAPSISLA